MITKILLSILVTAAQQDTTSLAYKQERFEYFKMLYNDNVDFNDSIARVAIRKVFYYSKGIEIDSFRRSAIFMNLGVTSANNTEESLGYYRLAWAWRPRANKILESKISGNMGFDFYKQLKIDSALKYYQIAINSCLTVGAPCITIRNNISLMYSDLGDRAEALNVLIPVANYLEVRYPNAKLDPNSESEYTSIPNILSNLVTNSLEIGDQLGAAHYLRFLNNVVRQNKFQSDFAMAAEAATAKYLAATGEVDKSLDILDVMREKIRHGSSVENEIVQGYLVLFAETVFEHHRTDRYGDAIDALRSIRQPTYRRQGSYYYLLGMFHLTQGNPDTAAYYLERSNQVKRAVGREVNVASKVILEYNKLERFDQPHQEIRAKYTWWEIPVVFAGGAATTLAFVLMLRLRRQRN